MSKILNEKLICDVMLPPATIIKRGCDLRTLLVAINQRGNLPPAQRVLREAALAKQPAPVAVPADYAIRARVADLLHLLQFAKIETPSEGDAAQAELAMNDIARMLAAAPAAPAAQEPVAWQDPENEDRICSARSKREAHRAGGATLTALKPLSRPLYAAPPAAEQPERGAYACPHCGAAIDLPAPYSAQVSCRTCGKSSAATAAQASAEQPYSTTSDKYRAELYDEVWEKALALGFVNVTEALAELEHMKAAEQSDTVKAPRELLERAAKSTANGWIDYPTSKGLRALLGKEGE